MTRRSAHAALLFALLALGACDNGTVPLGEEGRSAEGSADAPTDGTSGTGGSDPGSAGTAGGGEAGTAGADGTAGDGAAGADAAGTACGDATCGADAVCCSESCGLCTAEGTCREIACETPIHDPECGEDACGEKPLVATVLCLDGSTTDPYCERNADGVCAWVHHECPTATEERHCGSRGLDACPDGQLCFRGPDADCGRTDLPGVCMGYPEVCPAEHAPVCGCDGKTYSNRCIAASQGASVDYEGECKPEHDFCGGFAGFGCPDGFYCDYAAGDGCLVADGTGVCTEQPTVCTKEYAPVCGCDEKTYGNPCEAAAAGISVAHEGECGANGCGDASCSDAQFCSRPVGQCDAAGPCETRPDLCTLEYAPVCGCNGETYGNACTARAAGVSIASEGACH